MKEKVSKEEFIAKLKEAKSVDDIFALAKENGMEIAPEKAKELFELINGGELSDDALENVAGGLNIPTGGFLLQFPTNNG